MDSQNVAIFIKVTTSLLIIIHHDEEQQPFLKHKYIYLTLKTLSNSPIGILWSSSGRSSMCLYGICRHYRPTLGRLSANTSTELGRSTEASNTHDPIENNEKMNSNKSQFILLAFHYLHVDYQRMINKQRTAILRCASVF